MQHRRKTIPLKVADPQRKEKIQRSLRSKGRLATCSHSEPKARQVAMVKPAPKRIARSVPIAKAAYAVVRSKKVLRACIYDSMACSKGGMGRMPRLSILAFDKAE